MCFKNTKSVNYINLYVVFSSYTMWVCFPTKILYPFLQSFRDDNPTVEQAWGKIPGVSPWGVGLRWPSLWGRGGGQNPRRARPHKAGMPKAIPRSITRHRGSQDPLQQFQWPSPRWYSTGISNPLGKGGGGTMGSKRCGQSPKMRQA
jgi:hypothetical protein